jgi:phosphate transport system substrate-binding protein
LSGWNKDLIVTPSATHNQTGTAMNRISFRQSIQPAARMSLHVAGLLIACCLLTGCPSPTQPGSAPKQKLTLRGSNTIGEELAPRLIAEYLKTHANLEFDVEFKGTVYGIGALMSDRCDLAAASRELTTNEVALSKDREFQFNDYIIGSYSVAVVVNARNPVSQLTRDQVRDIFSGAIQNWKDVGGADAPIKLCIRDQISGTHLGFQELAMDRKPYAVAVKTFTDYDKMVQTVAQDADSIGYSSIELASSPGINGVIVDGASPTLESVKAGKYPYYRVLRFYSGKSKESAAALEFAKFVQSPAGQKILMDVGFVPHP